MSNLFKWPGSGFIQGISDHLKLVWRLMQDPRVPAWLKLLPFGSLLYFISPFDLPGPVDDIGVTWLFTSIFVEMSPLDVVQEHKAEIARVIHTEWSESDTPGQNGSEPIDAEFREKTDAETKEE